MALAPLEDIIRTVRQNNENHGARNILPACISKGDAFT